MILTMLTPLYKKSDVPHVLPYIAITLKPQQVKCLNNIDNLVTMASVKGWYIQQDNAPCHTRPTYTIFNQTHNQK